MADTGKPDDGTDLEMPSFSMRRRKKSRTEDEAVQPAPEATREAEQVPDPVVPAPAPVLDEPQQREPHVRRALPTLALAGVPAAAATGLVVGGLTLLVAWLAAAGCDAVRGTSACGGAAGLPILLVGLGLAAWVGSLLLSAFGVADSGSTSILAVGILAVLVMLFLLGSTDQWWMVIAVPVLAVASYVVSWWVTTAVAGEDSEVEAREPHDVR